MTDVDARRRAEARALAELALVELGGAVGGIHNVHRAVSDRIFKGVGLGLPRAARPAKLIHDTIADGIYKAVGTTAKGAGQVAGQTVDVRLDGGKLLSETSRGAALMSIVAGLRGDVLETEGSPLVSPMAVRVDGVVVPPESTALAAAFPQATGRLVVFLHGLMETEMAWRLGGRASYGELLIDELGVTPVFLRYNSGRRVSANGRSLSELLEQLVAAWPVPVEEIALVGHSMGGLISRSAAYQADSDGKYWVRRVHHLICLASPHMGAPLEQLVHFASAGLNVLPETRPFGRLLRRRSVGIRDLRQGSLVDGDWDGREVDALSKAVLQDVPLLDGVMHCFVTAQISRSPSRPLGKLIGDGLVLMPSGSGRSKRRIIGFREEDGLHVSSANHLSLLNHPAVYDKLVVWLSTAPIAISK
ncbi:esterase/lipase family protein [Antrihabitans cavernicola]|uniref:Alpha/beta fold hydrolase n=1 Tax=Antrihabitans cavernicola TaxID=2495913 RepID=A0A5A7SB15_9NOCA|nr:alpha/beta fold hydrolase [Spelaeibacter cavernicola]KAA0021725.1 alpha/beta fold hydrolase [Spelaeibacter cavernicola]